VYAIQRPSGDDLGLTQLSDVIADTPVLGSQRPTWPALSRKKRRLGTEAHVAMVMPVVD
jgi:hypothetical protein